MTRWLNGWFMKFWAASARCLLPHSFPRLSLVDEALQTFVDVSQLSLCVDDCGKSRALIISGSEFFSWWIILTMITQSLAQKICSMSNTGDFSVVVFATQPLSDGNNNSHSCKFNFFFFSCCSVRPQRNFSLANECKFSRAAFIHFNVLMFFNANKALSADGSIREQSPYN